MTSSHNISAITDSDVSIWDDFARVAADATIYHQSCWRTFCEDVLPHKPYYLAARDSSEKICGILPLFFMNNMFGKRLVSIPLRDRGGPVSQEDNVRNEMITAAVRIGKELSADYIELKNFRGDEINAELKCERETRQHWVSSVMEMPHSPEILWNSLKNNTTGPVKQSIKEGVVVREAGDREGVEAFARIFVSCRKHMGVPSYGAPFFHKMFEHLNDGKHLRLLLAEYKGKPVAGMILLAHNDTVTDGYAASIPQFRSLRSNDLLVWEALKWSIEHGFRRFDFGSDSPKQEGLIAFKRKWGARQEPLWTTIYRLSKRSARSWDSDDDSYRLARSLIRSMPGPLYRMISSTIIKRAG